MADTINISCKHATFLISKQQETKLSLINKMQLMWHLAICNVCKLYKKQTAYFLQKIKNSRTEDTKLSQTAKDKIKKIVEQVITENN